MAVFLAKKKRPASKRASKKVRVTVESAWPLQDSRELWLKRLREAYTPEVCERTLRLNASLPVHNER